MVPTRRRRGAGLRGLEKLPLRNPWRVVVRGAFPGGRVRDPEQPPGTGWCTSDCGCGPELELAPHRGSGGVAPPLRAQREKGTKRI